LDIINFKLDAGYYIDIDKISHCSIREHQDHI